MKKFALFALCLVLLGAGCANQEKNQEVEEDVSTIETVEIELDSLSGQELSIEIIGEDTLSVKSVDMAITDKAFDPASIAVEAGQRVEVSFGEVEEGYSFVIDEIELNEIIESNSMISFYAPDSGGEYKFYSEKGGLEGILHVKELD